MGSSLQYRVAAEAHRAAALRETLPNRREIHERAARLCDDMADRAEMALQVADKNAAAKALRAENARAREQRRRRAGLAARLEGRSGRASPSPSDRTLPPYV
jgi:hypothetical protein